MLLEDWIAGEAHIIHLSARLLIVGPHIHQLECLECTYILGLLAGMLGVLYCATIVLGRYSSHSGKIHYIQDANLSLYMQHHLWQTLAIYTSGLITPSIHGLLADFASVQAEPLMGH